MNPTDIPVRRPTPCYVYVTRREAGARAVYEIGCTVDAAGGSQSASRDRSVYLREFSDPIDALGHKLLLEQLSAASLRRFIRTYNVKHKTIKL